MCPIKHIFYNKQIRFISWYSKQQYWVSHDLRQNWMHLFPAGQFHIHGFSEPYRFDRNGNGGGILMYIREDIPSKLILTKMATEGFLSKSTWEKKMGPFLHNPKTFDIITFEQNWQKYWSIVI